MADLSDLRKTVASRLTEPLVSLLARTPVTPSTITWCGFLLSLGAGVLVARESLIAAGVLVLVAGLCDTLDGALARRTNRVSRFGAVLDSTLDRLSEAALLIGVSFIYIREAYAPGIILASVTLTGSLLVSYIRARAEGLGLECKTGLFTRTERVVIMALGIFLNQITIALGIVAALSFFTAGQRLLYVRKQTK